MMATFRPTNDAEANNTTSTGNSGNVSSNANGNGNADKKPKQQQNNQSNQPSSNNNFNASAMIASLFSPNRIPQHSQHPPTVRLAISLGPRSAISNSQGNVVSYKTLLHDLTTDGNNPFVADQDHHDVDDMDVDADAEGEGDNEAEADADADGHEEEADADDAEAEADADADAEEDEEEGDAEEEETNGKKKRRRRRKKKDWDEYDLDDDFIDDSEFLLPMNMEMNSDDFDYWNDIIGAGNTGHGLGLAPLRDDNEDTDDDDDGRDTQDERDDGNEGAMEDGADGEGENNERKKKKKAMKKQKPKKIESNLSKFGYFIWKGPIENMDNVVKKLNASEKSKNKPKVTVTAGIEDPDTNMVVEEEPEKAGEVFATPKPMKTANFLNDGKKDDKKKEKKEKKERKKKEKEPKEKEAEKEKTQENPTVTSANSPTSVNAASTEPNTATATAAGTPVEKVKKKRKPKEIIQAPVPEHLVPIHERLKALSAAQTWEKKSSFPPELKPVVYEFVDMFSFGCTSEAAKEAGNEGKPLDDVFYNWLQGMLPYNRFTIRKFCNKYLIPLRIGIKESLLTRSYEELRVAVAAQVEILEKIYAEKKKEDAVKVEQQQEQQPINPPPTQPTVQQQLQPMQVDQTQSGEPAQQEQQQQQLQAQPTSPAKKFRWNEPIRDYLYKIVNWECERAELKNELNGYMQIKDILKDTKVRRDSYQKIVAVFPDGWTTSYDISVQYSLLKRKRQPPSADDTPRKKSASGSGSGNLVAALTTGDAGEVKVETGVAAAAVVADTESPFLVAAVPTVPSVPTVPTTTTNSPTKPRKRKPKGEEGGETGAPTAGKKRKTSKDADGQEKPKMPRKKKSKDTQPLLGAGGAAPVGVAAATMIPSVAHVVVQELNTQTGTGVNNVAKNGL